MIKFAVNATFAIALSLLSLAAAAQEFSTQVATILA